MVIYVIEIKFLIEDVDYIKAIDALLSHYNGPLVKTKM